MTVDYFINNLINLGWKIELKTENTFKMDIFQTQIDSFSDSYQEFLTKVIYCRNPDNDIWFLCEDDFHGKSDSAFSWNEFELQSIESAENDEEAITRIKSFWKLHIPILISVKGYYSFLAFSIGEDKGSIFYGSEPEYEEVRKVSSSFDELMEKIVQAVNSEKDFELHRLLQ